MNNNKPLSVALVYNLKRELKDDALPPDFYAEFDSYETVNAIKDALAAGGREVSLIEADGNFLAWFMRNRPDIVFNIAEGHKGVGREAQVPAVLDFLNVPYTGSGVLALSISLDKALAKKVFIYEGISTPAFQLFKSEDEELNANLSFPLIAKPNAEGSAKGIDKTNVVQDGVSLRKKIKDILAVYKQPVLVEKFIDGVELTVGLLGNGAGLRPIGTLEVDFTTCKDIGEFFYTWVVKEYEFDPAKKIRTSHYSPPRLSDETKRMIEDVAIKAHRALGCDDFSRVDIRLGKDGIPYVLEVNPLPGLSPTNSNLPFIAKKAGMTYVELVNNMLDAALERWRMKGNGSSPFNLKGGREVGAGQLQAY